MSTLGSSDGHQENKERALVARSESIEYPKCGTLFGHFSRIDGCLHKSSSEAHLELTKGSLEVRKSLSFLDGNQNASEITSRRIFYCIRMYLLLRQDVFFFLLSPVKLQKNDRKRLILNRKNSVFAQYLHSFRPKISQKHLYFADFMPKVVIGGNKVTIKTPLITTRYSLIIKELSISVANVTLS